MECIVFKNICTNLIESKYVFLSLNTRWRWEKDKTSMPLYLWKKKKGNMVEDEFFYVQ